MSHHHHHPPTHGQAATLNADRRYLSASILLNLLFVGLEAFVGWRAGSLALLSDAGHNLSDVLGIGLALLAVTLNAKGSPSAARVSHWVTLINAGLLLLAVVVIAGEAIARLGQPLDIRADYMIWTAAAGIAVNGATAWLIGKGSGDNNLRLAFLHAASDALVSVGVVVSGIVIQFTGWTVMDLLISLAVSLIILVPTWRIIASELRVHLRGGSYEQEHG